MYTALKLVVIAHRAVLLLFSHIVNRLVLATGTCRNHYAIIIAISAAVTTCPSATASTVTATPAP